MMPCLEMATQKVHFKDCNGLCRQCSGCVLPMRCCFWSSHDPTTETRLETRHCQENLTQLLVSNSLAHDFTLSHVLKFKFLFNMYPVSIQTEICNQNSPHRLWGDSKQLTSPTHITVLLWLRETVFVTAATLCEVPDNFGRPECDCWFESLWFKLWTVSWVLNLLTHLYIIAWLGNSRHLNCFFFEL